MRQMSSRWSGPQVLALRQQPVPWAYRVFFRQIGLDPDETRTPVEHALVERLRWGGFRSRNRVDDALLIAVVETGVPVLAFDGDAVQGLVGLRLAYPGERLGGEGGVLTTGQIVLSDARRSLGVLFGELAGGGAVTRETKRLVLCAIQVKGVPEISVAEALWSAAEVLGAPLEEPGDRGETR
jgi:DNA/RNA-binding domain of Phe-tRNA-synthetase-like protein